MAPLVAARAAPHYPGATGAQKKNPYFRTAAAGQTGVLGSQQQPFIANRFNGRQQQLNQNQQMYQTNTLDENSNYFGLSSGMGKASASASAFRVSQYLPFHLQYALKSTGGQVNLPEQQPGGNAAARGNTGLVATDYVGAYGNQALEKNVYQNEKNVYQNGYNPQKQYHHRQTDLNRQQPLFIPQR